MAGWRSSPRLLQAYKALVCSRHRSLRLTGIAALSLAYILLTVPQWGGGRHARRAVLLALLLAAQAALLTAPLALAATVVAVASALVAVAVPQLDDHTGHRAGAEGYDGTPPGSPLCACNCCSMRLPGASWRTRRLPASRHTSRTWPCALQARCARTQPRRRRL